MSRLLRWYDWLLRLGLGFAGLMILGMAFMVSADVLLRLAGVRGLAWEVEVSEYLLYLSTLLGAPWVLRQGAHVSVDLLLRSVPAAVARSMVRLSSLIGLAVCLILTAYGLVAARQAHALGSLIFKQLVVPEWPLLAAIPLASLVLAAEFAARLKGREGGAGLGVESEPGA